MNSQPLNIFRVKSGRNVLNNIDPRSILNYFTNYFVNLRRRRHNEAPVMAPSRRVCLLIYFPMNIRKGTLSFPRKPRLLSSSASGRRMTGTLRHCSRDLRPDLHSRANRISTIHCELSFLPVALPFPVESTFARPKTPHQGVGTLVHRPRGKYYALQGKAYSPMKMLIAPKILREEIRMYLEKEITFFFSFYIEIFILY